MANEKLRYLISDVNPKEIAVHIEDGNLRVWCDRWRDAAFSCLNKVDAVEVVHGRWIHKGAWHIECSECQHILAHIGEAKNYCPYCGAKMDGGEWLK